MNLLFISLLLFAINASKATENSTSGICNDANVSNGVIVTVIPSKLQRTTIQTLELHLHASEEKLSCIFNFDDYHQAISTNATRTANRVTCNTPDPELLREIAPFKNNFVANLSVPITFYDCSAHVTCTECVSSKFPCAWCLNGHHCTHDTTEKCRNDILVSGISQIGPSYRSGPAYCPAIIPTIDGPEAVVHAGNKKRLLVYVHLIGQFIDQTRFTCQFNIEGRIRSVNARILGRSVYCVSMQFDYESKAPNITASFTVLWGWSKPLDNPQNIHVLIYKCDEMVRDKTDGEKADACRSLPEKFKCSWCESTLSCNVRDECP